MADKSARPKTIESQATKASRKQKASPEPESSAAESPPPGTDDVLHAKAQQHSARVELFRKGAFPAIMASALDLDSLADTSVYFTFLEQLRKDAGDPKDPIQRMLIEQMCLAHFRIAQLHASAQVADHHEGVNICNTAATRLMGEFRRGALALRILQGASDVDKASRSELKARIIKMAR